MSITAEQLAEIKTSLLADAKAAAVAAAKAEHRAEPVSRALRTAPILLASALPAPMGQVAPKMPSQGLSKAK